MGQRDPECAPRVTSLCFLQEVQGQPGPSQKVASDLVCRALESVSYQPIPLLATGSKSGLSMANLLESASCRFQGVCFLAQVFFIVSLTWPKSEA